MHKNDVERVFRKINMKPVLREKMGDYDLLFADGFSHPPHLSFQKREGLKPGDFPGGAYVTTWLLCRDDKLHVGHTLFFEPSEAFQTARINSARKAAERAHNVLVNHSNKIRQY